MVIQSYQDTFLLQSIVSGAYFSSDHGKQSAVPQQPTILRTYPVEIYSPLSTDHILARHCPPWGTDFNGVYLEVP